MFVVEIIKEYDLINKINRDDGVINETKYFID